MIELQLALDRIALSRAAYFAKKLGPHCEWIEVGTSLIKRYGMSAVSAVVNAAAETPVLADMKTVDDASHEFAMAYEAGASSATVIALAGDATVDLAVTAARRAERECMVDLMGVPDAGRRRLDERLDVRVVLAAHISRDNLQSGTDRETDLSVWKSDRRLAVAGGLTPERIRALPQDRALRLIVGSYVTSAADPVAAILDVRAAYGADQP